MIPQHVPSGGQQLLDPWAPVPFAARQRLAFRSAVALTVAAAGPIAWLLSVGHFARTIGLAAVAVTWLGLAAVVPSDGRGFAVQVVAGGACTILAPSGAHREAAQVMAALILAHGALVTWQPIRSWPRRGRAVAPMALPPIGIAGVLFFQRAPSAAIGATLAVALVLLEAYHRAPAVMTAVDDATTSTLGTLAAAIAAVLILVAAVPLLHLSGALGHFIARRRGPEARWQVRDVGHEEDLRSARRPFARLAPADRRRGHRANAAVAMVALALVAGTYAVARQRTGPPSDPSGPASHGQTTTFRDQVDVLFSSLPAYRGVPFADALKAEQDRFARSLRVDPATGLATNEVSGRYINVRDGVRQSALSTCERCPVATAWLVGGSFAFGLGQRDEHTIASELVRLAAGEGINLSIDNLAMPGWTLWQERVALKARLDAGVAPPDVLVEVGGFNDAAATLVDSLANGLDPDSPAILRSEDVIDVANGSTTVEHVGGISRLREVAAAKYRRAQAALAETASNGGIDRSSFFFQPSALTSPSQFAPVAGVIRGLPAWAAPDLRSILEAVAGSAPAEVVDLRPIYDRSPSLYVDWSHTNEVGASLAAVAIWEEIGPGVRAAAETA